MLTWLFAIVTIAAAGIPAPITTTPEEDTQLDRGEIVVRDHGAGETVGIADLKSTPKRTLEELLNLQPRVDGQAKG